jgi:nicotinate-nucleotide--dimethylbenzimidazole phosphoribosyltransferase
MFKLDNITNQIKPLDKNAMKIAKERQDSLTKPKGSLGTLEELSIKVAGITGKTLPMLKNKIIVTMAGDHGVVSEHVTAYPQEVTQQMVLNFVNGSAGINVIANQIGARVIVVDMGVRVDIQSPAIVNKKINYGTKNMVKRPAMTKEEAIKSIEAGIDIVENEVEGGVDIVATGDMGIGNTTASSAIVAAISGKPVFEVTGRGTGIDDRIFENKIKVVQKALAINKPNQNDPIDVLTKVGGFEIGGLAGVIVGCAANRIPVVIDGFISGASALIATAIAPQSKDYIIAGHCSTEPGHKIALDYMGLKPLLNLDMRLGEGTGAALGIFIVETACRILSDMATFDEAGVSKSTNSYA